MYLHAVGRAQLGGASTRTSRPLPPFYIPPPVGYVPQPPSPQRPQPAYGAAAPQLLPSWIIVGTQYAGTVYWTGGQWTNYGISYAKCFATLADAQAELKTLAFPYRNLSPGLLKTNCIR